MTGFTIGDVIPAPLRKGSCQLQLTEGSEGRKDEKQRKGLHPIPPSKRRRPLYTRGGEPIPVSAKWSEPILLYTRGRERST